MAILIEQESIEAPPPSSKGEAAFLFVVRCAPLIFAFAFLAPLFAELMRRSGFVLAGVSPTVAGLVLAGLWGLIAQIRGRWL